MIYVLLAVLLNVLIFLAFRSFSRFRIDTFPAILTNYAVCVITGVLFVGPEQLLRSSDPTAPWFISAVFLGLCFISTFYLMARTTQIRGVAVATVASKMSLAIPVFFSLFIFKYGTDDLNRWHYLGILLAFLAIILVTFKKKEDIPRSNIRRLGLPLAVFFLGGLIDTSLNFVNRQLINEQLSAVFPIYIFLFAFLIGLAFALIKRIPFGLKELIGGIYLGIPNYFSVYFILKALSYFENNGALVYPTVNVGIIILATFSAILLFNERLTKINWIGLFVAILVILLLSHQEMLTYLFR